MARFIAIRLAQFPLILAIIYLLTFVLVWVAPGDPFTRTDKKLAAEVLEGMKKRMHAQSARTFLAYYPLEMLRGNFGESFANDEFTVAQIIFGNGKSAGSLQISATLGLFALVLGLIIGVAIGALAAVWRGGVFDWASLSIVLLGISLPGFVSAAILFALFSAQLQWFPVGSFNSVRDLVLPGVALSLAPMAYIARLTRISMIDVLSADYIRTARAKGVGRSSVIWKHALRNAFLPVLSYLGPAAAATLTGSFVIEKVFNIPGLGAHFVNSVLNRDQTLILGTVMVYSVFLITLNLLVDIGYAFVDPRIDVTARSNAM